MACRIRTGIRCTFILCDDCNREIGDSPVTEIPIKLSDKMSLSLRPMEGHLESRVRFTVVAMLFGQFSHGACHDRIGDEGIA